jgi:hypothetical protein
MALTARCRARKAAGAKAWRSWKETVSALISSA